MAEDSKGAPDVERAMPVRSLRLPENLWERLTEKLAEVNSDRHRPVTMSSLIRILLEDRLEQIERPILFGRGIIRPSLGRESSAVAGSERHKSTRETVFKARLSTLPDHMPESNLVFDRFKVLITKERITPNAFVSNFLERFSGDRKMLVAFYHSGQTPPGQAGADLLTCVEEWISRTAKKG